MIRNNSSFRHIRHETNREGRNKIGNKEMRNIMFKEEKIKGLGRIRRNYFIENMGV
jgi:hypothetical protein